MEQIEGGHFSFTHAVLGWMNKMEDDGVSMVGAQSNYGSALLSPSKGLKGGLGGMGSDKRTEERQFLADVLKVFFSKYDKDGNGHLNVAEAEDYLESLAPGVAGRIEACLLGNPALAPVAALTKRNTCALCYSFVDAGEHLWPLRVYKDSGLCATSRLCEMGFALTTI